MVPKAETEVEQRQRLLGEIERGGNEKELVDQMWGRDVQAIFYAWLDQNMCKPNGVWGIERDVMVSERILNFVGEVLNRHPELNPLRHETWNFVRRAIDYAQLLGPRASNCRK